MKNFLVTYTMSVLVTVFLLAGSAAWAKKGPDTAYISAIKADMELVRDFAKDVHQLQDTQVVTPVIGKDDLISLMRDRADAMLDLTGLKSAADRRVGGYSKGMLQRIGLAQAIVHEPELVVLDEPAAGLDPAGIEDVTGLMLNLKDEGKTVLITSHLLPQIEEVCDRIAMLDRGRFIMDCAVSELPARDDRKLLDVSRLSGREIAELRAWLAARGRTIESMLPPRTRLEEIFLHAAARPERENPWA